MNPRSTQATRLSGIRPYPRDAPLPRARPLARGTPRNTLGEDSARDSTLLGYAGLHAALTTLGTDLGPRSASLLATMIHSMGGAPTSVARGLYLNTLI